MVTVTRVWSVLFDLVEQQRTRMEVNFALVWVDGLWVVWEVRGCVAYLVERSM
jgi:hypothetical protein